jgi:NAD(P)-dependent dehydrogenase (short-subunit alcohol dehydrogenase family)
MSSVAGLVGAQGFGYYAARSSRIEGLTETLRRGVEPFGVRVLARGSRERSAPAPSPTSRTTRHETVDAYVPMVEGVKAAFVDANGKQRVTLNAACKP